MHTEDMPVNYKLIKNSEKLGTPWKCCKKKQKHRPGSFYFPEYRAGF